MVSPLNSQASTLAGSSRASITPGTAARSPQASQQMASQAPDPANKPGDTQPGQTPGEEQELSRRDQQHQQHQQHPSRREQQQGRQQSNTYGHRGGGTQAGYRPAQARRPPFDMSTYAHFMLTHTKHQMDAVPNAEPPPAHLSIAGLPRELCRHTGHRNHLDHHPRNRTNTASPANGISS